MAFKPSEQASENTAEGRQVYQHSATTVKTIVSEYSNGNADVPRQSK